MTTCSTKVKTSQGRRPHGCLNIAPPRSNKCKGTFKHPRQKEMKARIGVIRSVSSRNWKIASLKIIKRLIFNNLFLIEFFCTDFHP